MNGPAFFGHVADYSSTTSIIAFVLIAVAILFIYLYNSLSMRRSQLDRQLAHIRIILKRRAELARQLAPDLPEFPLSAPIGRTAPHGHRSRRRREGAAGTRSGAIDRVQRTRKNARRHHRALPGQSRTVQPDRRKSGCELGNAALPFRTAGTVLTRDLLLHACKRERRQKSPSHVCRHDAFL